MRHIQKYQIFKKRQTLSKTDGFPYIISMDINMLHFQTCMIYILLPKGNIQYLHIPKKTPRTLSIVMATRWQKEPVKIYTFAFQKLSPQVEKLHIKH